MANEKRLIDANAFLKDILTAGIGKTIIEYSESDIGYMIRKRPTVDAVPVVRCRECKHFWHYGKTSLFINGKNIKAGWCQRRIRYDEEYRMTADDFCSYGERKDGHGNG